MSASGAKRLSAKVRLVVSPDGVGRVRIVTSPALQDLQWRRSVGYDRDAREHIWQEGVTSVEELMRRRGAYQFNASKSAGAELWRYLMLDLSIPQTGVWTEEGQYLERSLSVRRELELWDGAEERRAIELMSAQKTVALEWVNEGVVLAHPVSEMERSYWMQALQSTQGITKDAWLDELEEKAWRDSESWRPGPRPRKYRVRSAAQPDPPIPFFAQQSGQIPRTGRPDVGGVKLPAGKRYPGRYAAYWATHEPVPNIDMLAPFLSSVFPQTGLWPLLWEAGEDPDGYMAGGGDLTAIDGIDAGLVLRRAWAERATAREAIRPFVTFPGMTIGSPPLDHPTSPFSCLSDEALRRKRLLLVPCNRPADAITALGGLACDVEAPTISAVLRSWEQRFAAVPFEVAPSLVNVCALAPPTSSDQALQLAAEHYAFCPPENQDRPETIRDLASRLTAKRSPASEAGAIWRVGWYD